MTIADILKKYEMQYTELKSLAELFRQRALDDHPDRLIAENTNFLSKSFLVVSCAYLESFLKEAALHIVDCLESRLKSARIPQNAIKWTLKNEAGYKACKDEYRNLTIGITSKEIDDEVSGNPWRTKDFFQILGFNLAESEKEWKAQKEVIQSIITKRNKVVHHNDHASDVTLDDIASNIDVLTKYLVFISRITEKCDK